MAVSMNMTMYVPEQVRRRATQGRGGRAAVPPTREEALDFLRQAVHVEESKPRGFSQYKDTAYKMVDRVSMMRAVTTFYGKHASSKNAMERIAVADKVFLELEHAEVIERPVKSRMKKGTP